MNTPPKSAVRWGTAVVTLVILLLVLLSWLIKYPYIIRADAVITAKNPPAAIVARVSGRIDHLFVEDGEKVKAGTVLGIMETTASWESIQWLGSIFDTLKTEHIYGSRYLMFNQLPDNPVLGEIQDNYSSFRKSYTDYQNHIIIDYYGKKISAVNDEIRSIQDYIEQLKEKQQLTSLSLEVEKKKFLRDSLLNAQQILPDAVFELSKQSYYDLKIEKVQADLEEASRKIDLASKRQQLQDFMAVREEEFKKYRSGLEDEIIRLKARYYWWIQNYLLVSPVEGEVTFTSYWSENQIVNEGETVMTIVPENNSEIIARIYLPMEGSGKVKKDQRVNIRLDGYPYLEYGMVEGKIRSRSLVPDENLYIIEVSIPDGLTTFYGKNLQFSHNMSGTAEIITDDMRLMERLIYPFKYLVEKNRSIGEIQ